MQAVRRHTPVGAMMGLAVVLGLAGCSRQDEAAAPADSQPAVADKAPAVACHPKLQPMLEALPATVVNGVAAVSRECKGGAVTVRFGTETPGAQPGATFSYVLSTFQVDQSDLVSLGRKTGQKMLDDVRAGLTGVLQTQKDALASARQATGDDDTLTPQQRALLPQETRLPTGDRAVVFREEGQGWRMISFIGKDRALDIRWDDPRRLGLSSDEVVRVMLPLASQVKYELLLQ